MRRATAFTERELGPRNFDQRLKFVAPKPHHNAAILDSVAAGALVGLYGSHDQFVKQRLRFLQITQRVEAFSEPPVNRRHQFAAVGGYVS